MRSASTIARRASAATLMLALVAVGPGCATSGAPRAGRDAAVQLQSASQSAASDPIAVPVASRDDAGAELEEADPAPLPSLEEARADMTALLLATEVRSAYAWSEGRIAVAQKLGYDERRALRLLTTFVERGNKEGEILALAPLTDGAEAVSGDDAKKPVPVVDLLFAYLRRTASPRSLSRVFALAQRSGSYEGDRVVERLLARVASEQLDPKCTPPSSEEIAQQRMALGSFAVIERAGATLVAREPTDAELDDWAYFQAALAQDGGVVGKDLPSPPPSSTGAASAPQGPATNPALDAERATLDLALASGEPKLIQSTARSYLRLLGFPGAIRAEDESRLTFGGPGYANVMRDLAEVDELLGDTAEAAVLYRRAPPGGGVCGTSVPYRLRRQREGVIRTAERAGQCRSVVRERLYAMPDDHFDYGPTRLSTAGWDVARLYRAALLTVERHAPADELARALDRLPSPRREEALARLERVGVEAWAHDIRALGGLADVRGERALTDLLPLARSGSEDVRVEALRVLAELGDLPASDPCAPDRGTGIRMHRIGGEPPRKVKQLNHVCATKLTATAQAAIVDVFVGAAKDPSDRVREAVAEGLAGVAGPSWAEPILRALARDPYARPGWSHVGKNNQQTPVLPVAEAARSSLDRLRNERKRAENRRRERAASGRHVAGD